MTDEPLINLDDEAIETAVGTAVHAYSGVEEAQVVLLRQILGVMPYPASIIFHSVLTVGIRNEMIAGLLHYAHQDTFTKYWKKCSDFLLKLSAFRNAVVHWHPLINVYVDTKNDMRPARIEHAIRNPMHGRNLRPLETKDFAPFVQDCNYIQTEIHELARFLKTFRHDEPLPDKFQQPAIRPNRAVLQSRNKPKAKQHRPRSSQAETHKTRKESAKQRRQRLLAQAARKRNS